MALLNGRCMQHMPKQQSTAPPKEGRTYTYTIPSRSKQCWCEQYTALLQVAFLWMYQHHNLTRSIVSQGSTGKKWNVHSISEAHAQSLAGRTKPYFLLSRCSTVLREPATRKEPCKGTGAHRWQQRMSKSEPGSKLLKEKLPHASSQPGWLLRTKWVVH